MTLPQGAQAKAGYHALGKDELPSAPCCADVAFGLLGHCQPLTRQIFILPFDEAGRALGDLLAFGCASAVSRRSRFTDLVHSHSCSPPRVPKKVYGQSSDRRSAHRSAAVSPFTARKISERVSPI